MNRSRSDSQCGAWRSAFLRRLAVVLAVVMALSQSVRAELNQLSESEQAEGWVLLFDGETTFGWRAAGDADFTIQDGVIRVTSGDVCLLRTTAQFADYELHVDFRAAEGTNSGIFLRTPPVPRNPSNDCYELNIAPPDNPFPTGSFVGRQRVDVPAAADEWHHYEVRAERGKFTVKLDGNVVLDYEDPRPLGHGYIGLQHNQGQVEFRNVKLKPLGLEPIFNGRDLTHWKAYPEMDSVFAVNEAGELTVQNGPGQLETAASYGDFVLQLDAISHADQLNSGIFFRCIPGDTMMGYESQIHNGFQNGDRSQPVDCGTGGIFRRVNARRVVSDDKQWFHKTIIAHGPHISVWVNGYQVTDWTDQRAAHENPRKGLRTQPGTIMIQGHDPTTDLSFRQIRIVETPSRWP